MCIRDRDLTAVKDFFERVQTQAFAENIQEAVKLLTKASSIIFVGVDVYKRQPVAGARASATSAVRRDVSDRETERLSSIN